MNHYDIVFIGQMGKTTILPFNRPSLIEENSPVSFAAIAASIIQKRIAAVTKIPEGKDYVLQPMKDRGIDVFASPGEIGETRVSLPTADPDERHAIVLKRGDSLHIDDIPLFESNLIHLCCFGPRSVQLDLMRALKARGSRLSVDIQGFVFQPDTSTGAVHLEDIQEKKEIFSLADFVKMDAVEAQILTGAKVLQDQADILESWGCSEVVITCAEGALARGLGAVTFCRFTNTSIVGRMGRGDTVMGSYLARRLDHSAEDSLRFAVALTSIKLESAGPFKGSLAEVLARM